VNTLGNDPTSPPTTFPAQSNILFKGKPALPGKIFVFIQSSEGYKLPVWKRKLSLYAENGGATAMVILRAFGWRNRKRYRQRQGRTVIKPFLNDEKFVNGGITNETPILILKLSDSSGINTSSTGIGHDLVATLDDDDNQFFILNDFFQADLNSYQQGKVSFQLPELEPGPHRLKVKPGMS
jgi:hypothetical protein